jgi:hypothetical protein
MRNFSFGMTIKQASQQILNAFIVPVSTLLLITVIGAVAAGTGFIVNQIQKQEMQAEAIGGERRRA